MKYQRLNSKHEILIGASPRDADLSIVSIDNEGNLGELNEFVLVQYGYAIEDLPKKEQLQVAGFGSIPNTNGKAILFVVTKDGNNNPANALEVNLYSTLIEFREWFINKKVWLPLMGTGSAGLSFEQSYEATAKAVNKFQANNPTEVFFIISFPKIDRAYLFYEQLKNDLSNDSNIVKEYLEKLNCNFYLVSNFLKDKNEVAKYLQKGFLEIVEDAHKISGVINNIKINDIVILNCNLFQNDKSVLNIKGIGIVSDMFSDRSKIMVDWRINDINIVIHDFHNIILPIDFIAIREVIEVFSYLDPFELQKLFPSSTILPIKQNIVASLISDSDRGVDYLNITKDITAFARVISSKNFEPPLAIALFGKWGSGKSFFMRKLREYIESLSEIDSSNMYCQGVVHIHFNAWSYMDANLWASFVSKIFEGLNEYITNNTSSLQVKKEVEAELNATLNIAKEGMQELESKKKSIQQQIDILEEKRNSIKKEVEENILKLQTKTTWSVIKEIDEKFQVKKTVIDSLEYNSTYIKSKKDLKLIVPEKYWNDPKELYRQISSKYTFAKEFFRIEKIGKNLLYLTLILVIIFLTPVLLQFVDEKISKINFLIPQAGLTFMLIFGSAWKRCEIVYNKLQPLIATFWKIKVDYEEKLNEYLSKFQQEEKALKLEIEKGKDELLSINEQLQKAEAIMSDIQFKLDNTIATEALYSFIEKKSKSEDYKKHLGIISIIRRDFEILNGLFTDHKQEIINSDRVAAFRGKFKKPLERIVLYIDDLDRCPEENVVQVLEAVNLLMAFPLFVVIVGVDPRWVKNALIKKYSIQFSGKIPYGLDNELGIDFIEPSNYLEKIFQVAFHLKDASSISVKEMIRQLATISKQTPIFSNSKSNLDNPISNFDLKNINERVSINDKTKMNIESHPVVNEYSDYFSKSIELLKFSEDEVNIMQDMSELIGPNPRALKRFINIYKIVKAHEDYTVSKQALKEDILVVQFLLALSSGRFKRLIPAFESYIEDQRFEAQPVSNFFEEFKYAIELSKMKDDLREVLFSNNNFITIQQIKANVFSKHNGFIRRFTFNNI
ncbi:MAG: hypothetical protein JNK20_13560 [Flavipsychrobacter sp.]|nr:hypothetical protein [Flavipsychrobacter sp.]